MATIFAVMNDFKDLLQLFDKTFFLFMELFIIVPSHFFKCILCHDTYKSVSIDLLDENTVIKRLLLKKIQVKTQYHESYLNALICLTAVANLIMLFHKSMLQQWEISPY